jgi:hypothetical protein
MDHDEQQKIDLFLKNEILFGLRNENTGYDVASISYFSENNFRIILNRIKQEKVGLFGIEPWLNGEFFDVITFTKFNTVPDDPIWYETAFANFCTLKLDLAYSASFYIPTDRLSFQTEL